MFQINVQRDYRIVRGLFLTRFLVVLTAHCDLKNGWNATVFEHRLYLLQKCHYYLSEIHHNACSTRKQRSTCPRTRIKVFSRRLNPFVVVIRNVHVGFGCAVEIDSHSVRLSVLVHDAYSSHHTLLPLFLVIRLVSFACFIEPVRCLEQAFGVVSAQRVRTRMPARYWRRAIKAIVHLEFHSLSNTAPVDHPEISLTSCHIYEMCRPQYRCGRSDRSALLIDSSLS